MTHSDTFDPWVWEELTERIDHALEALPANDPRWIAIKELLSFGEILIQHSNDEASKLLCNQLSELTTVSRYSESGNSHPQSAAEGAGHLLANEILHHARGESAATNERIKSRLESGMGEEDARIDSSNEPQ